MVMAASDLDQRALVDALDDPAFVVEGLLVSVANDAARSVLGDSIEGRDVRLAVRQPELLEHVLSGRHGDLDVAGIGDFGRPWRVAVRPLGLGTVFVRMSDRSKYLGAEKMRVDFVANASHELRTPLAAILGYAETLGDSEIEPKIRKKFARTLRDEAQRMLGIIEDLMSLSRIEADRFVAPAEDVSISEVVTTAIANAGHFGECAFDVSIPDDLPPIRGDRGQLLQVLDNLIGNAVRYGCDGPGAKVEIAATRKGRIVNLTVTDHGPGIPRDHLPRVTERFYRVDAARSRESGGTGLGLAIVKHIVERHRGTLAINSTEGVGTVVRIGLPVAG